MYRAYDTLAGLAAQPGTDLVAGHDPLVRDRFAPYRPAAGRPDASVAGPAGAPLQVTDLTRRLAD
jgi:hypothetical protein